VSASIKSRKQRRRKFRRHYQKKQRRIRRRLEHRQRQESDEDAPVFSARNIHYDVADRTAAISAGGIGGIHLLATRSGLADRIDEYLHLLKEHKPYHESDHVLNIALNVMAGGHCLEDLELRRGDEAYMDALGAERIPDPTTAGDFCRRFEEGDVLALMRAINETRIEMWQQQPASFFEEAVIDADGVLTPTTGECKEGMDIAYNGVWGYHPLVISLANTGEVLFIANRSGNRPSHEDAADYLDQAAALCREAGFKRVRFRGDTDFSQTRFLDGWDEAGHCFVFGIDAMANLKKLANELDESEWEKIERPPKYTVKTRRRSRPANVKRQIVREKAYKHIELKGEEVAEIEYSPTACRKTYRLVIVRKNLSVEKGEERLFDEIRYFFYLTNDREKSPAEIVFDANDRCDQENLIAQLSGGVRALRAPVDNLVSNWAYMVMASLAWTLKAWFALSLPESPRWRKKHQVEKQTLLRMEFRTFCNAFMNVPCQIVRGGRRIVYRLLGWNLWQDVFLRIVEALRCRPMRC